MRPVMSSTRASRRSRTFRVRHPGFLPVSGPPVGEVDGGALLGPRGREQSRATGLVREQDTWP
jgi:hypothetical protein